jgi:biofilm PGA synthesis protein PgaA
MLAVLPGALLAAALTLAHTLLAMPPAAHAQQAERQEAVRLAREGRLEPAIAALQELRRRYPDDIPTAADLTTVLTWAGRNQEALAVFAPIGPDLAPGYAIVAASRAARLVGDLPRADAYLARALERFPTDRTARALRVLVLTDLQRFEEARALFWPLAAVDPQDVDVLLAGGYFHAQATEWAESLRFYEEVLQQDPGNREALRGRVVALEALQAPFQAEEVARATPGLLDPMQAARVAGTRSAMQTRWGVLPADDPAVSRAETDRAIAVLEAQVAELRARPLPEATALHRARIDLLIAYRNRRRMADAVAVYEGLQRDGVAIPPYARRSAAAAYLYLEQPEVAEALYRSALADEPGDVDTGLGLFYSLIEQERYGDAYAVIDALDRAQPPFRQYAGSPAVYDNPQKLDTAVPAARARQYGDQLAEGWDRISALAGAGPASVWLQIEKAAVARARGWPRYTLDIVEPWRTLGVDDPGLELERANALLDISRYDEAEPVIERLQTRYPDEKDVQDLARRWDAHQRWEVESRVDIGRGTEPTSDGVELTAATRLFTPPLAYQWRLGVGYTFIAADVPEGRVDLHRSSLLAEYRGPLLAGILEIAGIVGTLDRIGGSVAGAITPDDHWIIRGGGEIFSHATPLRAVKTGVTADSVFAGLGYRFHESRHIDLTWRFMNFSDGNDRHEAFLNASQRVVDVPRFDLTAGLELYGSTNTRSDTAYFSPEWMVTPAVALIADHLAWRRYRKVFVQTGVLTVGGTFQKGFDAAPIVEARYEHRWGWEPRFELAYGVRGGSRVFDGDRQEEYGGFVEFRGRF